jgi:DedD protein
VGLLAILVIVAGAAGALYFSGLIPGMGPGAKMQPPLQTAEKPKAPESAPAGERQKQQAEEEKTASAPAAVAVAPAAPVKSAAPASPSPAATAAKPSGKTIYSVQVGAFKSEKNADALAKQLKEKGYDAFSVKRSAKDGNTIYRVLVGRFDDRRGSRQLASAIGKKEKISTVIVSE